MKEAAIPVLIAAAISLLAITTNADEASPDAVVDALRAANDKILADAVAKDAMTKKVHESYMGYMATYKQWAKYSEKPYYDKILGI